MDENYRVIYKIPKALVKTMNIGETDFLGIQAEELGISKQRWTHITKICHASDQLMSGFGCMA